ncbi:hypothetical protein [Flaviaesturariibacter aridisoli]|uniref:hypothetical protein n=1 Tax=Flaviaesturariibacter aridisoli TaxID=2545761 RepID=UPI0014054685|nr:hypothetical protein [Flaviaesturariibacter aridisoli]
MTFLRNAILLLLLLYAANTRAQSSISNDSLNRVIDQVMAGEHPEGWENVVTEGSDTIPTPEGTGVGTVIAVSQKEEPRDADGFTPGEKRYNDRMWLLARIVIFGGAAGFCLWAAVYKKRYREMHTRNGVYYGIGSKYYHDHYEQDHYTGSEWGPTAAEDPWCAGAQQERIIEYRQQQRRTRRPRQGGGASARW